MSVEVLGRHDDGLRGLHSSRSMAFHNSTLSVRRTLPVSGAIVQSKSPRAALMSEKGPVDSQGELLVCNMCEISHLQEQLRYIISVFKVHT